MNCQPPIKKLKYTRFSIKAAKTVFGDSNNEPAKKMTKKYKNFGGLTS